MSTLLSMALSAMALSATTLLITCHAIAASAGSEELRARIVESNLKDLSATNEAAIGRQSLDPIRTLDAQGMPRVDLQPREQNQTDQLVRQEVASSLHRLRRETASSQTEDGRKARIDETLTRAADQRIR
jgi:hypothetical protein